MIEPMTDTIPVFGHVEDPRATFDFAIEYLDLRTDEIGREQFTAYVDPGGGPVIAYLNSKSDPTAEINLARRLIFQAVLDKDGLSASYVDPTKPDDWDEKEAERVKNSDANEEPRAWNVQDAPGYDPRTNDPSQWSSARRFAFLATDAYRKMPGSVVTEIADHMAQKAFGRRPTKTP